MSGAGRTGVAGLPRRSFGTLAAVHRSLIADEQRTPRSSRSRGSLGLRPKLHRTHPPPTWNPRVSADLARTRSARAARRNAHGRPASCGKPARRGQGRRRRPGHRHHAFHRRRLRCPSVRHDVPRRSWSPSTG
jgi:hypothetical protein